ncbi:hypothetical protein GCM10025876_36530 [Demequina litorisediminis]|uniref:Glutamate synthase central-N domain-containing protein n=1 Tax=Demequina litorisediminis TaxID=1849022 RepID=A0ABQ6IHU2_9MICO|nr:hypothetical protein GCM10025876_36530 [Demequina litorisediminis]
MLHIDADPRLKGVFSARKIRGLYRVTDGHEGLERRLDDIFDEVDQAIREGVSFIVLSDRDSNQDFAPIPSLLLTAAVHHHLVRNHTRTRASLLVEAGDVREVHHVALLIGYGCAAVNPYLAMETIEDLGERGYLGDIEPSKAVKNYIKALGKGVLKIMSKMGISTIQSYRGAQVFEALGLSREPGQPSLHRHPEPGGWCRPRRHRGRGGASPRRCLPGVRRPAPARAAQHRRRVPVASRRRRAPLRSAHGVQACSTRRVPVSTTFSVSTRTGSTISPRGS